MKDIPKSRKIIIYNIISLCYLYAIIAFAFALIYMIIDLAGLGGLYDNNETENNLNLIEILFIHIYFSFTTLTLLGYGDIQPFGLTRFFCIFQALIGYILPYVIVLKTIIFSPKFLRAINLDE